MELQMPSLEERQQWDYEKYERKIQIARMRASVLRKQITEAYEILEDIRFDFLGDTAFRDKITTAKKGCERAMSDFLLDDSYHKDNLEKHRAKTPAQYAEEQNHQNEPTQSSVS